MLAARGVATTFRGAVLVTVMRNCAVAPLPRRAVCGIPFTASCTGLVAVVTAPVRKAADDGEARISTLNLSLAVCVLGV